MCVIWLLKCNGQLRPVQCLCCSWGGQATAGRHSPSSAHSERVAREYTHPESAVPTETGLQNRKQDSSVASSAHKYTHTHTARLPINLSQIHTGHIAASLQQLCLLHLHYTNNSVLPPSSRHLEEINLSIKCKQNLYVKLSISIDYLLCAMHEDKFLKI